jgi:ABC-2 type transport system ATP-binding protein
MSEVAISVHHVSKVFNLPHERTTSIKGAVVNFWRRDRSIERLKVLDDVSFEVQKGDFFGIVGRNGSGKSTLLKLIAGIYSPTEGHIQVHGKLTPFIELGVGFSPELTGRENIFLNGSLLGFNRKEMEGMYNDIVEFAELKQFMDQKLKNYSSGMQVRLAFSIAIRANSPILLLDEVLAVGDEAFQRKCYDYFESLRRQNKTVIIVTHDMAAVARFCTKAILVESGKVVRQGSPEVVAKAYSDMLSPHHESGVNQTDDSKRFGDKRLTFTKSSIKFENPDRVGSNILLQTEVLCNVPVDDEVVVAFAIKDSMGQKLIGYNGYSSLGNMKEKERVSVSFTIPNVLNKGKYFIDFSIYLVKEQTFTDCWIECLKLITETQGTDPYPVIVDTKFDVGKPK